MASKDKAPVRRIGKPEHLDLFVESSTARELEQFMDELNAASEGKECKVRYDGKCLGVAKGLELLEEKEKLLKEFPPVVQGARFGNVAFRSWLDKVQETSVDDMGAFLPEKAKEIAGYWWNSFGNGKRLDYGTGHEASFLVWMFALHKVDVLTDLEGAALVLFPRYLDLAYAVQTQYRLEPAGSHGVWSLDDYHILPFLLGSSQFCNTKGRSMASAPKYSLDKVLVEGLASKNLYMKALARITETKTGPFTEHSPLLTDIGTMVKTWKEVNDGLMRMYRGEVLGKFPVVQHFLFGSLFPCTWELSKEDLDALDNASHSVANAPTAFKSPFAMAAVMGPRSGGDPLASYFHITRKPIVPGSAGEACPIGASKPGYFDTPMPGRGASPVPPATPGQSTQGAAGNFGKRDMKIKGFEITTNKARISSDAEIDRLKDEHTFNGFKLDFPLPEMLFGQNYVRILHEASGVAVEFNALDAACCCKILRDEEGNGDRVVFKLPNADRWAQRKDAEGKTIKAWRDDYDWTYTSTYEGTVTKAGVEGQRIPVKVSTEKEIDYEMLKRKDPILFFDSLDLFEDDLFDNGESKFSIKLRVMPGCLFVLARMWLRVDNTYVRSYDTRVFHVFGDDEILFETSRKEASAEQLKDKGFQDMRIMLDSEKVEKLLPIVQKRMESVKLF